MSMRQGEAGIVGSYQSRQARSLGGLTSQDVIVEVTRGALADAGLTLADIDGFNVRTTHPISDTYAYQLGAEYFWIGSRLPGPDAVAEAADAIRAGLANVVLIASAQAGIYTERGSTAPWTRPNHEFIEVWGLHTPAEWALLSRRHMHLYGTTPEQAAHVAAIVRNNGHVNPEAVYFGKGPFTKEDILASRLVADPYRLLDCAMTAEGGAAIIVTSAERAKDLRKKPVNILGGGFESWGPEYTYPPTFERKGRLGKKSADVAFAQAGLARESVDVLELYDNFSYEIIRTLEQFGYCKPGEGGDFVTSGVLEKGGKLPMVTDGGTMSHSHTGASQILQRVCQASRQLWSEASANQVEDARIALASWPYGVVLLGVD
ncbi:MAG: thiolase family protein [Sphingomonadales bacterium]|nr:MAG: thiolase family protein [Sphingomonadales bacterium]